jgi:hypothetical protein
MQLLQNPSQSNVDSINNIRCVASRHFWGEEKYLNAKIEELETNSKIKYIMDLKYIRDLYRASVTLGRSTSLELI